MESKKNTELSLNTLDREILSAIFEIKDMNLSVISKRVGVSKSTVHNRLKKLKSANYINGVIPLVDHSQIDSGMTAFSLIKAKYGPEYAGEIGKRISKVRGVWAVYFILGSNDFVALIRAKEKADLERIVNDLSNTEGVERSDTVISLKTVKEDFPESFRLLTD